MHNIRTPFRTSLYLWTADLILLVARGAVRRGYAEPGLLVPALRAANGLARAAMRNWRRADRRWAAPSRLPMGRAKP